MPLNFDDFKKKYTLETNKAIPQCVVDLPSSGAKASLRPMMVREQKEVLKALERRDEYLINGALDAILANCVLTVNDEAFDGDKLCVQDRIFLLIKIREITTGAKSKITHISPNTGKTYENIEIELDKLVVKKYEGKSIKQVVALTPSLKIVLGPVTRKNEKDIEKYLKSNKDKDVSLIDRRYAAYAAILKSVIMTEDGEDKTLDLTFYQSIEFITTMTHQKDLDLFDNYIKTELDFGVELTINLVDDEYNNTKEELALISFFIM